MQITVGICLVSAVVGIVRHVLPLFAVWDTILFAVVMIPCVDGNNFFNHLSLNNFSISNSASVMAATNGDTNPWHRKTAAEVIANNTSNEINSNANLSDINDWPTLGEVHKTEVIITKDIPLRPNCVLNLLIR